MLIRSQNKRALVNINGCDSICIMDQTGTRYMKIYAYNGSEEDGILLGEYSTAEKAVKVLDMIQENYSLALMTNCLWSGYISELINDSKETVGAVGDNHREAYVFQMPEDREV